MKESWISLQQETSKCLFTVKDWSIIGGKNNCLVKRTYCRELEKYQHFLDDLNMFLIILAKFESH